MQTEMMATLILVEIQQAIFFGKNDTGSKSQLTAKSTYLKVN